jgi:hypothetical protein
MEFVQDIVKDLCVGSHLKEAGGKENANNVVPERGRKVQVAVAYPGFFFGWGSSTNSVEGIENGDLGAVAP